MLNPGARNAGPGCALRVMTVSGYWRPLSSNGLGTASPSVGSGGAGTATGRMRDSDDVLSPERVRVLRAERVQRRQRLGNVLAWRRVVTRIFFERAHALAGDLRDGIRHGYRG